MGRIQEEIYQIIEQMGGYATGKIIKDKSSANAQVVGRHLKKMSDAGIITRRLSYPGKLPTVDNPYFYSVKAK